MLIVNSSQQPLFYSRMNKIAGPKSLIFVVIDAKSLPNLSWIWKLEIPNKVTHFLWLASLDKLATKHILFRRKIVADQHCPVCSADIENAVHVLKSCVTAQKFWDDLRFPFTTPDSNNFSD